ncbi:hypothetical protein HK096_008836, partial [Nowakowskiella sp. JEL0078]
NCQQLKNSLIHNARNFRNNDKAVSKASLGWGINATVRNTKSAFLIWRLLCSTCFPNKLPGVSLLKIRFPLGILTRTGTTAKYNPRLFLFLLKVFFAACLGRDFLANHHLLRCLWRRFVCFLSRDRKELPQCRV